MVHVVYVYIFIWILLYTYCVFYCIVHCMYIFGLLLRDWIYATSPINPPSTLHRRNETTMRNMSVPNDPLSTDGLIGDGEWIVHRPLSTAVGNPPGVSPIKKNSTRWTVHREEKFLIGDTLGGRWIISISPVEGGRWIDWGRSIRKEAYAVAACDQTDNGKNKKPFRNKSNRSYATI